MTGTKKSIEEWPFLRWIKSRNRWMVDARTKTGGQRRFFSSKEKAQDWRQTQLVQKENQGRESFDETDLKPFGLTVADAIKFTVEHYRRISASTTIEEAIAALVEHKRKAGQDEGYCRSLEGRCLKLCPPQKEENEETRDQKEEAKQLRFNGRIIGTIGTAELNDFLLNLPVAPGTKNTIRRDICTLWSFAEKQNWAVAKIARDTTISKEEKKNVGTLSPEEAKDLLQACDDVCLPAVTLALFCGIRDAELKKLSFKDVDLKEGVVNIDAHVAKTNSRRSIHIPQNAFKWLKLKKWQGPVVPSGFRIHFDRVRVRAGFRPSFEGRVDKELQKLLGEAESLKDWPENAMRHSAISYRLALKVKDLNTIAFESGNSPQIIKQHYYKLKTPSEAKKYFAIVPKP